MSKVDWESIIWILGVIVGAVLMVLLIPPRDAPITPVSSSKTVILTHTCIKDNGSWCTVFEVTKTYLD